MNPIASSALARPALGAPAWLSLVVLASLMCAPLASQSQPGDQVARVYLAAKGGSDGADGLSVSAPVATLQKALDRAAALLEGQKSKVEVVVARGRYMKQTARLKNVKVNKSLVLQADCGGDNGCAVFDGEGEGRWLAVDYADGGGGALEIKGLAVVNYLQAIAALGSRDDPKKSVSNISIVDNQFRGIGQILASAKNPSSGALVFVNVDGSRIERNSFVDIRNREQCGSNHAIYLAHGSTGNTVRGNTFERGCGDAVRLRDGSGGNTITENTFSDFWAKAPVSDWYCDKGARDDCTKAGGECPSYGNVVSKNRMERKQLKAAPLTTTYGADDSTNCPKPAGGKRFIEN